MHSNVDMSSLSTRSGADTLPRSWHTGVCPYTVDVATYGDTREPATYRQVSCQVEYNWIDR